MTAPLLDGLRVVEVAILAPNMVGMHLADLGADVIKVEVPGRGDYTHSVGLARANGVSFLHLRWNRGKRSVALDLRAPEGVEVFLDLVRRSEVVIEGMRAGALAKRGVGYEELRAVNPAIVFCATSGFGQTGPFRDLATHGVAYDAYAGLAPPERTAEGFPAIPSDYRDIGTQAGALYATIGILAAVTRARATGEGAWIDVAQADAAVTWSAGRLDAVMTAARVAEVAGELTTRAADDAARGPSMVDAVRYQYYETADDRLILFQASERHFFERFCRAVGREDLLAGDVGEEFGEHASGDVALRRELAQIFATRTQQEWVEFLLEVDVPGAPVHRVADLPGDANFRARADIVEHDHPVAGPLRLLGTPIRTDAPHAPMGAAPSTGDHTDDVLRGVLGYDDARIEALRAAGVVA
jgi:crotonobetainyl-CoA:carnitine CoA-transferase CaiB-like acyl-CoA transferase